MDRTLRYFCSQLEDKFINGVNHGNVCDFDAWMSYCESRPADSRDF